MQGGEGDLLYKEKIYFNKLENIHYWIKQGYTKKKRKLYMNRSILHFQTNHS